MNTSDFGISRVFSSDNIKEDAKKRLKIRLYDTDEMIKKHGLMPFFAGVTSLKDIQSKIPKSFFVDGTTYSYKQIKISLSNVALINDKNSIQRRISNFINLLVDKYFNQDSGKFVFPETNDSDSGNVKLHEVWINLIYILALIKWQLYLSKKSKKINRVIRKSIEWLNDNIDIYDSDSCGCKNIADANHVLKTYECALALQTLMRAEKLQWELKSLDFESEVERIIEFQSKVKDSTSGCWPSEIECHKNESGACISDHANYEKSVEATAFTLQFLADYFESNRNNGMNDYIVRSLRKGCTWLISKQNIKTGSWINQDAESIELTSYAVQSLVKCRKIPAIKIPKIGTAIDRGINWLGKSFCVPEGSDGIIYAWPQDSNKYLACAKNTSLVVSTLLKADISSDSFVLRKSVLWLLENQTAINPYQIYAFCAILEYLKYMKPSYVDLNSASQ